jgi:hypothetical protein
MAFLQPYSITFGQNFHNHIDFLCSETIGGRDNLISQENCSKYIQSQLESVFDIEKQSFHYVINDVSEKNAINILCVSKNTADSSIVCIAHFDHLGKNSTKSLEIIPSKKNQMHPGADDNASGVAMVMEIGKWFAQIENPSFRIVLLFTSGHEDGLFGSENFVKSNNIEAMKIKAIFNFDMVGRLDVSSKSLSISDNQNAIAYYESIPSTFHLMKEDIILNSDLKHFVDFPIHLVNITTGVHDDYHRITDTPDKINYNGMNDIYEYMKKVILNLA